MFYHIKNTVELGDKILVRIISAMRNFSDVFITLNYTFVGG